MRVMITGGTGFVGYHSAKALMNAGHEVCLLVRSEAKAKKLFGDDTPDCVVGDIIDERSVARSMDGCDAAIHSAAMVSTDRKDADLVYNTNVDGAKLVINTALEQGIESIIHVSSVTALYDPDAKVLDGDSPPGTAKNAYGRSKVACEKFVRGLEAEGAPINITYPATVMGPEDPGLTEPHIGLQMYLTSFIPDIPSGNQYVDVRDVAEVHRRLLERGGSSERYTLGGHYLPWTELQPMLEQLTGRKLRRLPATGGIMRGLGRAIDMLKYVKTVDVPMGHEAMVYATNWVQMDNSKVEQDLDFSFRPLEDSMTDAIQGLCKSGHITAQQAGKLAPRESV